MRIWLVTVGEPLPIDKSDVRLLRAGILAKLMEQRGHKVVWWSSSFNHTLKEQRVGSDNYFKVNNNFKIILLHSIAYRSNVSVRRLLNHYGIAVKFACLTKKELRPDIILCSFPTIELSVAAVRYGRKNAVPVLLDIRDLWPDIFLELVPSWARGTANMLLYPMYKEVRYACANATAIIGITKDYVDWGIKHTGRKATSLDKYFPLGYSEVKPSEDEISESKLFWSKLGITDGNNDFIACFFGTMGRQFEIETVIEAARILKGKGRRFRFVLCGNGDNLEHYKDLAKDCENVIFPGWVGVGEIWTLMGFSSVGLAPYLSIENFTKNLPNKPIEYLSAGLPVISSLRGILDDELKNHECGITYQNGNGNQLAAALIELYDNPTLMEKMSKNALELFKKKFVAEKVYGEMIDYLEYVAKGE